MSRSRRCHPVRLRRRVPATPRGAAVTNPSQGLILTPMTMLASLQLPSTPPMRPSQLSGGGNWGVSSRPGTGCYR